MMKIRILYQAIEEADDSFLPENDETDPDAKTALEIPKNPGSDPVLVKNILAALEKTPNSFDVKNSSSNSADISSIPLAAELLSQKSDIFDKKAPVLKSEPFSAKEIRDEKLAKKEKKRLKKEMKEKERKEGNYEDNILKEKSALQF